MIRLNMLPDVKREYIRTRRLQAKVIAMATLATLGAIGIIVLLALWTYGAQTLQKNSLSDSISRNMAELKSIKDVDKYVTIQNQLANIDALHEKKAIYSRLFDILPKLNPAAPNSVRINTLTLDGSSTSMTLEGQTTTFTALQTFRDTLQNAQLAYRLNDDENNAEPEALFETVTVETQGIGRGTNGQAVVSFRIFTKYNLKVFQRSVVLNDVLVPNKETTQSTVDAPSVFAESQPTTTEGEQ